ncbi:MAG: NAD(P)/FAD-dependent oxidoreductase [bacterium]
MKSIVTVAIIGAGPAGIAAAFQLKRYEIEFRIFEKRNIGGLLLNAHRVENYPGFPYGISGISLIKHFQKQLHLTGIRVDKEEIKEVDYDSGNKCFKLISDQSVVRCLFLIVASGTIPRELPELSPFLKKSKNIFYEILPLKNCKRKNIAIIGAGDAAFDYALNLAAKKNKVMIFNRSNFHKCLSLLFREAKKNPSISYFQNYQLKKMEENRSGLSLTFMCQETEHSFGVDYLLIAIGRDPALDFLSENLILRKNVLIKKRIFHFIGDVHSGFYRQTGIAVGEGIKTAMIIYDKLKEKSGNFINSGQG